MRADDREEEMAEPTTTTTTRRDHATATTLIVASVLSVVLMAFHPSLHHGTTAEAIAEIAEKGRVNAIVHGGLIALAGLLLACFWSFAERLDLRHPAVRIGAVAYACGTATLAGAAVVNGFVVSGLGAHYAGRPAADLEALCHLMNLCGVANQTLARIGVVATSTAIVAWSLILAGRGGSPRGVGVFGVLAGGATAVAIVCGLLPLNVHGMGAVVLLQSIWSVAVGVVWMRGRLGPRSET
jgi:hypothetical protein